MKAALFIFALCLVVPLAGIWGFNYSVDVSGLNTRTDELATRQNADLVIVSETEFDQRSWVKRRLQEECPAILVLGSSTVGTLQQEMFPGRRLLNAWLTGASIEDYEAVTALLHALDCKPQRIIFGIDLFLANDLVTSDRWRVLADYQAAYDDSGATTRLVADRWRSKWSRFKERLSYETTRDSLKRVLEDGWNQLSGPRLMRATDVCAQVHKLAFVRHFDGHFSYCDQWRVSADGVTELARSYLERDFHKVRSWRQLSSSRLARLSRVVKRLSTRTGQLIMVTPPYHPVTFQLLEQDQRVGSLITELDRAIQAQCVGIVNCRVALLRDPRRSACSANEFFDSHHVAPACAARVTEQIQGAGR